MSITTRFISDLHFGHKNMAIKRGFQSELEHDIYIIKLWNSVVEPKDITWILGDITMEKVDSYYKLNSLNGIKKVILGNHDQSQHVPELLNYVDRVAGMVDIENKIYGNFILTHCPIHTNELEFRYKYNIHGHVHENSLKDIRYINVCCEAINYTPKTLEQLFKNI